MRKVIIGGTFDEQGGKSSYIVSGLSTALGNFMSMLILFYYQVLAK